MSKLSPPILAVLLVLELAWCARARLRVHDPADSFSNIANGLIYAAFGAFFFPLIFVLYTWIHEYRLWDLPRAWWMFGVLMLADDFINYWVHRLLHENRFWWAIHEPHHSSEEFNFTTGIRLTVVTALTIWPFWAILPFLGFPPEWVLIQNTISHLYGLFTHTRVIPKLGPLEWVLVTPSHHRVHHGRNIPYLDRNYGIMFIFWDRLFGSFEAEDPVGEPVRYGVLHPVPTKNPLLVQLHPWRALARELAETPGWYDRACVLLNPPGWRPGGKGLTARQMQRLSRAPGPQETPAKSR